MSSWCRSRFQAGIEFFHQRSVPRVVVQRSELRNGPHEEQVLRAIIVGLLERLKRSVLLAERHIDLREACMINILLPRRGFELCQYAARLLTVANVRVANRRFVV